MVSSGTGCVLSGVALRSDSEVRIAGLTVAEAHRVIEHVVRSMVRGRAHDVADAVQHVWNQILGALARGRAPEHHPIAWWRSAARNTVLNTFRRRDALDDPSRVEPIEPWLDEGEGRRWRWHDCGAESELELELWIRSLSARQRAIVGLLREGWSGREIAVALELSPTTVSRERRSLGLSSQRWLGYGPPPTGPDAPSDAAADAGSDETPGPSWRARPISLDSAASSTS